jgi:hypothetical protein
MSELSQAALVELSKWIDDGNSARLDRMTREQLADELLLLHRTIKVAEELGEAVQKLIGVTGANPRKGITAQRADVVDELLDVAVTALGAIEHIVGHDYYALERLDRKIVQVAKRAGVIS